MTLQRARRAAIVGFLHLLLPFLVLAGIVDMSVDTLAAAEGLETAGVTLAFLFLPGATGEDGSP